MSSIELHIEKKFSKTFIKMVGTLEHMEALELKQRLLSLIERNMDMVLDIREVGDWSLNGLNAILISSIKLRQVGGKLTLRVPADHTIHEYLALTKMNCLLEINITSPKSIAA